MTIRKLAAVSIIVASSFAATSVAPSKTELEAMYSKAFHEFDANNFEQALTDLDEIDARQPDLAESQNLRGVIYMRQRLYEKAEAALFEAVRIDPKFWNARFNLAEIPFLKKDWAEARKRFQQLLSANASDLQGDAAQLIQYKILLTYLLEGKENIVDSILAKFELSPDTPAMHYANAAIALQRNNQNEAKDWIAKAEKDFSPQLNKLFAESLYEIGWLEKPAGQARASLPLTTGAERAAQAKAFANSHFEQAQQALQQRDYPAAEKFVDQADTADPNQAPIINLRGEILMAQKKYDEAEAAFKKAAKLDPKFREAQYNLADIPFKKQDYAKARERFETLFEQIPGGDKNQASQIIKFKIFMTLLLEGKESRAQKMMEQFQFTGDTPALYYAQAAWEFKHNNPTKAADWITSAKKIYSPTLNNLFGDAFYDLGWIETQGTVATAAPASEAAAALSRQGESLPAIEPSPIPGAIASRTKANEKAAAASASQTVPGMEATTANSEPPASVAQAQPSTAPIIATAAGTPAKPEEITAAPAAATSPPVETPVAAPAAAAEPAKAAAQPVASAPATALAPARVGELSQPRIAEARHPWLVAALLIAGLFLLAWGVVSMLRRRFGGISLYRRPVPATGPRVNGLNFASVDEEMAAARPRLVGGPRRVSLQLKASEPSLRRGVAIARSAAAAPPPVRPITAEPAVELEGDSDLATESLLKASVGAAAKPAETARFDVAVDGTEAETAAASSAEVSVETGAEDIETPRFDFAPDSESEPIVEGATVTSGGEPTETPQFDFAAELESEAVSASSPENFESATAVGVDQTPQLDFAPEVELQPTSEAGLEPCEPRPQEAVATPRIELPPDVDFATSVAPVPELRQPSEFEPSGNGQEADFAAAEPDVFTAPELSEPEPVPQGQPVPYQIPVADAQPPAEDLNEPLLTPNNFEPSIPQATSNTTAMPETIQVPTSPIVRTPTAVPTPPQPSGAMHTAVQLTFSFEIASMQLTPTFKMGALQVRPISKVVTMRLAPAQQPQPAMNLQVTFEVAKIQPSGGALGTLRLTPSQQQRPTPSGSPSFNVAGLQLVPNFEAAPVQLTPSTQGQAIVLVTAPFQIGTVEFSPSFEIASIVLTSNSRQVAVQLPGAPPPSGEAAPLFEIANLQLTGGGEIGLMQLNLLGHGARRPAAAAAAA